MIELNDSILEKKHIRILKEVDIPLAILSICATVLFFKMPIENISDPFLVKGYLITFILFNFFIGQIRHKYSSNVLESLRFLFGFPLTMTIFIAAGGVHTNFWYLFLINTLGYVSIHHIQNRISSTILIYSNVTAYCILYFVDSLAKSMSNEAFWSMNWLMPIFIQLAIVLLAKTQKKTMSHFLSEQIEQEKSADDIIKLTKMNNELKKMQSKLIGSQKKMSEFDKSKALSTMSSGLAHELNNPLTGILWSIRVLEKTESLSERGFKYTHNMTEMIKRATDIISQIRILADGAVFIEPKPMSIQDFIDNCLEQYRNQLENQSIVYNIIAKGAPSVIIDPQVAALIFKSLIDNSIFSILESGKDTKSIVIEIHVAVQGMEIFIIDNGMGIEEKNLTEVFHPFFTTHEVGQGTGLGLSVAQSIAGRLGGTIKVQSELGIGATFSIVFDFEKMINIKNKSDQDKISA